MQLIALQLHVLFCKRAVRFLQRYVKWNLAERIDTTMERKVRFCFAQFRSGIFFVKNNQLYFNITYNLLYSKSASRCYIP